MNAEKEKYMLRQHSEYEDNDWWNWEVFVEAADEDLDRIAYVEYTLHPTFANPVRKVIDRQTKFLLKEEGWASFTLYAKLFLKNEATVLLEQTLKLTYPDGEVLQPHKEKRSPVAADWSHMTSASVGAPAPAPSRAVPMAEAAPAGRKSGKKYWLFSLLGIGVVAVVFFSTGLFTANNSAKPLSYDKSDTEIGQPINVGSGNDDTENKANPDRVTVVLSKKALKASMADSAKIVNEMAIDGNDKLIFQRHPEFWVTYFSRTINEKDRTIKALQKQVDSLHVVLRSATKKDRVSLQPIERKH